MPTLVLYGLPSGFASCNALENLVVRDLPSAASSTPDMGITEGQVKVIVPAVLASNIEGQALVVFVPDLFSRPKRTPSVIKQFAEAILRCVREFASEHLPSCSTIEVVTHTQQPTDGYASWPR